MPISETLEDFRAAIRKGAGQFMRLVVTLSKSLTDAEVCQFDAELATGEK